MNGKVIRSLVLFGDIIIIGSLTLLLSKTLKVEQNKKVYKTNHSGAVGALGAVLTGNTLEGERR